MQWLKKQIRWKIYLQTKTDKEFKTKRTEVKHLIKEGKKQLWEKFGRKMNENENMGTIYGTLKHIKQEKSPSQTKKYIKDKEGKILTTEKEIIDIRKQYFKQLTKENQAKQEILDK